MDTIKEITNKLAYIGTEKTYHNCVFAGIIPYKDSNDLVYFTEKDQPDIIEGPPGIQGFQHIEANKDFVKCKRSEGLYYFYLRKKKWLAYKNSGENSETNYHFYGDGIIYSDDWMMHVVTENCNYGVHKEFAVYLLEEDRFVPDLTYAQHVCGIFKQQSCDTEIEMRTVNNKSCRTLLLKARYDEKNPWGLYSIETNEFFAIPFPEVFQEKHKDIRTTISFYYVSDKYAVLKLRNQKAYVDNFHLYDITQGKYLNFDKEHESRLDEKYWKPQHMLCTTEYVCIQYLKAAHQSEPWWEILSVVDWKPIKLTFTYEISSAFFSNVSVIEDAEIITAKIMHVGELIKQI